jgi:hypothetical protein
MRLDKENTISFNTLIGTAGVVAQGTTNHGAVIDNVKAGNSKDELYLVGSVRESITSANPAATVQIKILQDSAANFGTAETIIDTGALALTGLTAGTRLFAQRLPLALKRYIKATLTVATADTTGGKLDIFLVDGIDFKGM